MKEKPRGQDEEEGRPAQGGKASWYLMCVYVSVVRSILPVPVFDKYVCDTAVSDEGMRASQAVGDNHGE